MSPGLVVLLTWAAVAAAVPTASVPVRVDFAAPAGCADADTFWAGIVTRTDRARLAHAGDAAMRVTVRLARAGTKVHGELRIVVPGGHLEARRVEGATCAEVVQVLSLTAALAIDPSITLGGGPPAGGTPGKAAGGTAGKAAAGEPGRSEPSAAASPPGESPRPEAANPTPPPPPPATPPPPPEPPPLPPERPRVATTPASPPVPREPPAPSAPAPARGAALGASVVAARLLTSALSLGGQISGRLASARDPRSPSVTLSALFLGGDFFHSGDDLGLRWLALAVDGCPGWRLGGVASVEPCLRLTGGLMTVTDHSVSKPRTVDRWWSSGGAVLHVEVGTGTGFWFRAEAGVDIAFVERRFVTTTAVPAQPVGSTASISPTLAVGLAHSL